MADIYRPKQIPQSNHNPLAASDKGINQLTTSQSPGQHRSASAYSLSMLNPTTIYAVLNTFSKVHFRYSLTYATLFLAFDVFKTYIVKASVQEAAVKRVAVACLNLAVKYEQIYPPSLKSLATHFQITMSHEEYLLLEFHILQTLDYQLANFESQVDFSAATTVNQLKCLLIELSAITPSIADCFSRQTILQAINLILSPLSHCEVDCEQSILLCSKKLVIERTHLSSSHQWLFKKYNRSSLRVVSGTPHSVPSKPSKSRK